MHLWAAWFGLHIYMQKSAVATGFKVPPAIAALGCSRQHRATLVPSHFLCGIFWSGWEWVHGVANVTPARRLEYGLHVTYIPALIFDQSSCPIAAVSS